MLPQPPGVVQAGSGLETVPAGGFARCQQGIYPALELSRCANTEIPKGPTPNSALIVCVDVRKDAPRVLSYNLTTQSHAPILSYPPEVDSLPSVGGKGQGEGVLAVSGHLDTSLHWTNLRLRTLESDALRQASPVGSSAPGDALPKHDQVLYPLR